MGFKLPGLQSQEQKQETKSTDSEMQSLRQTAASKLQQQAAWLAEKDEIISEQDQQITALQQEVEKQKDDKRKMNEHYQLRLDAQRKVADRKWSDEYELRVEAEGKVRSAQERYTSSVERYRLGLCVAIGYGLLITVFTGINTAEFRLACAQFGQILAGTEPVWQAIFGFPSWCAGGAAAWSDNELMSVVWYWIVMISTWGMVGFGLLMGVSAVAGGVIYCKEHLSDLQTLTVILITVAVSVFFAGPLQEMGINAVLLILLVIAGYFAVRMINVYRTNRQQ